ncbi:MAG: discoidin domain-containing protein [Verrucomicrobia bacterium]|nr:discoidin domain-containing protein [Verrucomicrobiota bacterium]
MQPPRARFGFVLGWILGLGLGAWAGPMSVTPEDWRQRVEADWIFAEEVALMGTVTRAVSTQADAAGGCDGVKTGEWGFHTGGSPAPWWQVDLGEEAVIERVVIWNRREAAERAARIRVLLSEDGQAFRQVYQHDGTIFGGLAGGQPLTVELPEATGRFVRLALSGQDYLHLDEVEVFGVTGLNLALRRPADQSSVSPWSVDHAAGPAEVNWITRARETLAVCARLLQEAPQPVLGDRLVRLTAQLEAWPADQSGQPLFLEARRLQRELALANPLLREIDTLLFTKRRPGSFDHMSDQYYGWWSKPGGGIYLLRNITSDTPTEQCLTTAFDPSGSFLRPTLSYDGRRILFAWCRHYPHLAAEPDKLNKANVPEDAFFHLFEMNLDGTGIRQLTHGKYDDFDGRYLPDGRVVFLSTRRGQALQVGRDSAARTVARPDLPDSYVRCGGGPERPVAVYTLHTMNADGSDLVAISPFEMFEWTPEIARDGSILYSRWDYIDRDNMPYMGLWAIGPDGGNARMVYGNYTQSPHCAFEAKPIPGSSKIIFTASAHHAQTMGSLVLLDPGVGLEGEAPITRLTPEVAFPEIEGWPRTSYASPWPLSERFHLVAWGAEGAHRPGPAGWDRWYAVGRPDNGMALYLYDAATRTRELLWADADTACGDPIPVRPRERPPILASQFAGSAAPEGRFLLTDVYQGLPGVRRGTIKSLRLVAVPAKTHPTMNAPNLGITNDDPGKCVLGTVPVEADGSAYFRVPAGVIVFFQALDDRGLALQTMRSVTHVQPGQTLSCIGCHEHRQQAPPVKPALAAGREPSRLTLGPDGSWPLRFDQLIQPVLEAQCVGCHHPAAANAVAAKFDLTPAKAYENLVKFGQPSVHDQVWEAYRRGRSLPGDGIAQRSALFAWLEAPPAPCRIELDAQTRERWLTWLDTYAQRLGHFDQEQERELVELKWRSADLLIEPMVARSTYGIRTSE